MPNGGNAKYRESVLRRHGQAGLDELRRKWAKSRKRMRYQRKFERIYGRPVSTDIDRRIVRQMMRGCPPACTCFDCQYEPDVREEFRPRVCGANYNP